MPPSYFTVEEVKQMIGVEQEPSFYDIEKEPIRRWADAIGDPNPLYHDEEYAKKLGFRSIIAPPGFLANNEFPVKQGNIIKYPHISSRSLNGGNEYEFYIPVQAGDRISRTLRIADVYERTGKSGELIIIISEQLYRNQNGELVGLNRHTGINYR